MNLYTVEWVVNYLDTCVSEDKNLLEDCREDIIDAAKIMVELEEKYIDKMFEMGDIEGIKLMT